MKELARIISIGAQRDVRKEGDKLVTGPGGIQGYVNLQFPDGKDCKVWIPEEAMMEIGKAIAAHSGDVSPDIQ